MQVVPELGKTRKKRLNAARFTRLINITSLLCTSTFGPRTHLKADPVSAASAAVKAPLYAIHPSLPASKTVLRPWSLLVIRPLVAPGVTRTTGTRHYVRDICTIR